MNGTTMLARGIKLILFLWLACSASAVQFQAYTNQHTLFVDPNGVNSRAIKGIPEMPWADPVTARNAASSGDTIHVFPGSYAIHTNNLAKDGVNWNFDKATIIGTNTIWSDLGSGAKSFTVEGSGTFFSYGSASIEGSATVYLTNSGSRVTFNCLRITNANYAAVETIDSEVTLNVSDSIGSREYDAVWHDGVAGTGVGKVHVHCPVVVGGNNALELTGGTTWWNVDYCKGGWSGSGAPTFNISGGSNYMTSDLVDFGNGPSTLSISGGSNILSAKQVVGLVQVNSGALKLQGATVLATGSSAAIGPPGASASVILENCNLDLSQSSAVVSIGNAPGARTIRVLGTLTYDPAKPPGANISVISVDGTQNRILSVGQYTGNGAGLSNAVVIAAGSGITSTPSGNGRTYTIAATGGGGSSFPLTVDTQIGTNLTSVFDLQFNPSIDAANHLGFTWNSENGGMKFYAGLSAGNAANIIDSANPWVFKQNNTIYGATTFYDGATVNAGAASLDIPNRRGYGPDSQITYSWELAGKLWLPSPTIIHGNGAGLTNVGTYSPKVSALAFTGGTNLIMDCSLAGNFTLTLTTNGFLIPINMSPMQDITVDVRQNAAGTYSLSYSNIIKFPSAQILTLTTNAGAWSMLSMKVGQYATNLACVQTLNFQ